MFFKKGWCKMERFYGSRIKLVLIGFVAVILLGRGSAIADFTFGTPAPVPNVNNVQADGNPSISTDGRELFFGSNRPGGNGNSDIWVAMRETTEDDWGEPVNLGSNVNSPYEERYPNVSANGLSLYFTSSRHGGFGGTDIWVTTRKTTSDPWEQPVNLGSTVNKSGDEWESFISTNELALYFTCDWPGGSGSFDIWVTTRQMKEDPWAPAENLGPTVNSSSGDGAPCISGDGLTLFFCSSWPSSPYVLDFYDLYITRRSNTGVDWIELDNLGPTVNSTSGDVSPSVSSDGRMLYFSSQRQGGPGDWDIWQVPILPIVDLNGDGIVDASDMCAIVDYWGTDEQLCDIGPMPWGDGIVDVHDLIVLAEHLFEDVNDMTLVAHWALDETEGMIAADSAGDNDATVVGGTTWQPSSGLIDGALKLNGVDGCLIAGPVLNPAGGSFSIVAWIKGDVPGQVFVSQQAAANWLSTDVQGRLKTELSGTGQDSNPLQSHTVITDGDWHRIGFVWDGSYRSLYVDSVVVANDTQPDLEGSQNSIYIGVGKDYATGTFFSGLIDDVRIYNRVVNP
jgi:hypothetical protein